MNPEVMENNTKKTQANSEKDSLDNSLGRKLKKVMIPAVYKKQVVWAMHLDVDKSTVSQWFHNTSIPSPKNFLRIWEIIHNVGDEDAKANLRELYRTPLVKITPKYESFKADTLEEYAAGVLIDKIVLNLKTFPETKSIEYYSQVSAALNVFYTFDKEERKTFTAFLKSISESIDFRKTFNALRVIYGGLFIAPSIKSVDKLKSLSLASDNFDGHVSMPIKYLKKILDRFPDLKDSRIKIEAFLYGKAIPSKTPLNGREKDTTIANQKSDRLTTKANASNFA